MPDNLNSNIEKATEMLALTSNEALTYFQALVVLSLLTCCPACTYKPNIYDIID